MILVEVNREVIRQLKADLAEARTELRELLPEWRKALDDLAEARAQIAAKDAALRELAAILKRDDDNNAVMMIIADNALAAPAQAQPAQETGQEEH